MRHHRFAAHGHFAHAVRTRIDYPDLHSGHRLAQCIRPKWLHIVYRNGRARLRAPISIKDLYADIMEKFQSLWLAERAADQERAQFAAKSFVNILQQCPAQPQTWTPTR